MFCEHYDPFISIHYLPHSDIFSLCPFFYSSLIPLNFLENFKIDIIDYNNLLITSLGDYLSGTDSSNIYRTYNLKKPAKFNPALRKVSFGVDIYEKNI